MVRILSKQRCCILFSLVTYLISQLAWLVGSRAFTIHGFQSLKKVNDGENCAFLSYIGKDPNSLHKKAIMQFRDLMNQAQYIPHVITKQTSQQIGNNRMILKASIDTFRWFTFQAFSLRDHNKCAHLTNPGNILKLIKLLASYT